MAEYYVYNPRDARVGYQDNCILWWRAGGHGYTTDLNNAGIFTDHDRAKGYPSQQYIWVPVEVARRAAKTMVLVWDVDIPVELRERAEAKASA